MAELDRAALNHFERIAAFHVHRSAMIEQQFDQGRVAVATGSGGEQRCEAAAVGGVYGGALGQQEANQLDVIGTGGLFDHAHATFIAGDDEASPRPLVASLDAEWHTCFPGARSGNHGSRRSISASNAGSVLKAIAAELTRDTAHFASGLARGVHGIPASPGRPATSH